MSGIQTPNYQMPGNRENGPNVGIDADKVRYDIYHEGSENYLNRETLDGYDAYRGESYNPRDKNVWATETTQQGFADPVHTNRWTVNFSPLQTVLLNAGIIGSNIDIFAVKARSVSGFIPAVTVSEISDNFINQPQYFAGDKQWGSHQLTITFLQTEDLIIDNILWFLVNGLDRTNPKIPVSGGTWERKRGGYALDLQVSQLSYQGHRPLRTVVYKNAWISNLTLPASLTYGPNQGAQSVSAIFTFDYPDIIL